MSTRKIVADGRQIDVCVDIGGAVRRLLPVTTIFFVDVAEEAPPNEPRVSTISRVGLLCSGTEEGVAQELIRKEEAMPTELIPRSTDGRPTKGDQP